MVALFRAPALLLLGLTIAACGGKPGPEDPAVAVGTGIPIGAASAVGVSFDPPLAVADPPRSAGGKIKELPKPLPLDPFDPGEPSAPTPPIKPSKKKGTSL